MISLPMTVLVMTISTLLIGAVYRVQYKLPRRWRWPVVVVHFCSVSAIIVSYCLLCLTYYQPGIFAWIGWFIFVCGTVGFWYSTFIHRTCLVPDEAKGLTNQGPYKRVRHPMYSSGLLAALGLIGVAFTWQVFVAWLALLAALSVLTIFEEQELNARLGSAYQSYVRRTKRLIPGVL